jgi:peptide/nickel transport system permease protein
VILVIAILEWAATARIIRAQVMSVKERVYIKRARSIGASHVRIIGRHILPQVGPLLMANTVLTIAVAIYLETALAFLGLEDPSTTTWGTILEHAFDRAAVSAGAWWAIVPDGIVITLLIMGCFLLGQAIEDALNPRLKVAHLSSRRWALRPLAGRGPDAI